MLESLGIPLPGETALIIAAAYAGSTHHLSAWAVFGVAAAAAIMGDNVGFWIGGQGGYRLARAYGPRIGLDERKLKIARYLFDIYGPKVVFFGRFTALLRTYAAFLAGASRMAWPRFLPANAAGGIVWAGVYTAAAYAAGDTLRRLSGPLGAALTVAGLLAIVGGGLFIRRRLRKLAPRAEAAYPGPLD